MSRKIWCIQKGLVCANTEVCRARNDASPPADPTSRYEAILRAVYADGSLEVQP